MKHCNHTILLYKETIKKLIIVKKKQFSRTNVFIQNRSISFDKQTVFDFNQEQIYYSPFIKLVNSSKDRMLLQFKKWL